MKTNTMNKFLKHIMYVLILLLGMAGSSAFAVTLSFVPANQTVQLGDQATVDVMVTGLVEQYVGTYDFNVSWDASLLSLTNVDFDIYLDSPFSFQSVDASTAGSVNVAELSFDGLFNQDGSSDFRLFSLTFDTLDAGTSLLNFTGNIGGDPTAFLGDAFGSLLQTDAGLGSITIERTAGVPEPSSLLLLMTAGMFMFGARRFN
ncbi:MAG: cohesin domain-containing protein [Gammaproteobacteria bacterium]|nr:cohesin domain-containing protein [Gammaproteobacteria bacterium]